MEAQAGTLLPPHTAWSSQSPGPILGFWLECSPRGWSDGQNDGTIAGLERKVGVRVPWTPADGMAGMIPCQASWWS